MKIDVSGLTRSCFVLVLLATTVRCSSFGPDDEDRPPPSTPAEDASGTPGNTAGTPGNTGGTPGNAAGTPSTQAGAPTTDAGMQSSDARTKGPETESSSGEASVDGAMPVTAEPCEPRVESCDFEDDDCDFSVDEGCECSLDEERSCGSSLGECEEGVQTCSDGRWGECEDATFPSEEQCDAEDDDCDGNVDESCDCRHGTTRSCSFAEGACGAGSQTCNFGSWGRCEPTQAPATEDCDAEDNDCDGLVDEGYHLERPCDSTGRCPQTRVCSEDGKSSLCGDDESLFEEERCDGVDNDCDGLVDVVSDRGRLRSTCECDGRQLSAGAVEDASIMGDLNLCTATRCQGEIRRLELDGICYPICQTTSDPDGDGWGWEDSASCLVEGSARAASADHCLLPTTADFLSIGYCLDCQGTEGLPYAMCQTENRFDFRAFAQGREWMRVSYTYNATGPAEAPVNVWFDADDLRKRLPLVMIGDLPGQYVKLLRVDDACFTASHFGSACQAEAQACAHCGPDEACGAAAACGAYDLSEARIQVAAEFCLAASGLQSGTVSVQRIELVEPNCDH